MRILAIATAAALMASVAGVAGAAEPSAWVRCDGQPRPEGLGKQLAKAGAEILTVGIYGFTQEKPGAPATGAEGVAACTQVLQDPVLETFWARRISLLRSRALHAVEAGDPDAGLRDLEATRAAVAGHVDDLAFNRSLGVSTKLFEAALLAKRGRIAEAERLAVEAADARPWSARIQSLASAILAIDPLYGPDEDRVLTRQASLDPDGLAARALAREWSDPSGAADDWAMLAADIRRLEPQGRLIIESLEYEDGSAVRLPLPLARAALAAARAGRPDQARALLAELEGLTPWAPPVMPKNKYQAARAQSTMARSKAVILATAPYQALTKAWLLAGEGRYSDARALMVGDAPVEPATLDLLRVIAKGPGEPPAAADRAWAELRTSVSTRRTDQLVVLRYALTLPLLEPDSRWTHHPGKPMSGLSGRDWTLKSGERAVSVEGYRGMAIAEEQALLRAAQIARQAGAARFVVVGRRDFERFFVSAYSPRPTAGVDPNPQSVQTVSEFVLLNPAAPAPFVARAALALDAERIWADLEPVYLQPPAAR